jgi:hypothetical protein
VSLYFPNIHHDPYMVPFLLGTVYALLRRRYVLAGISFGLALAAKNTAVMLVPVILLWVLLRRLSGHHSPVPASAESRECCSLKDLLVVGSAAFITLLPFANPWSYVSEVLTPVTGREFDRRGENVDQFTLKSVASSGSLGEQALSEQVDSIGEKIGTIRPGVRLLQNLVPWSVYIGFVLVAILACASRLNGPVFTISFLFTLMAFPHSLVFGDGLIWRSIVFAPFFALVMTAWAESRSRWVVLGAMACIVTVLLVDPLTARGNASPDPSQRWWSVWIS